VPISPNREATATEILDRRSSQATGYIADPAADPIIPDLPIHRLRSLLGQFGDPHLTTPFVHVAGSNGKTSTCHFIASICRAAGYNAGLYSSPHLHSYRERIGISGSLIPRDAFERLIGQLDLAASAIESNWPDLGAFSAFDLLTAAAFVWFADQDCEIAVIEVGLGGRYDPTNVISPVLSVITPIELEHTEFLGTDIASIAENKAGIIKTGIPVVSTRQQHAAQVVIERTAAELGSAVLLQERDWRIVGQHNAFDLTDTSGTVTCILDPPGGVSQRNNAGTAACAARHLQGIALIIDDVSIREGIAATTIPGRFERRTIDGIEYVLDGAHTSDAMRQLVNSVTSTASSP